MELSLKINWVALSLCCARAHSGKINIPDTLMCTAALCYKKYYPANFSTCDFL